MSIPWAVVVVQSKEYPLAFGPYDQDEAEPLAKEIERKLELPAFALPLRGWTGTR